MSKILSTIALAFLLTITSCNSKNDLPPQEQEPSAKVELPITGKYEWEFEIPTVGKQTSTHIFTEALITYEMKGSAYNNSYNMIPESYNKTEQRLVAVGKGGEGNYDKDGRYFVLFLKDITPTSVTIYKKECASKQEANSVKVPVADDAENHGWNVYVKK